MIQWLVFPFTATRESQTSFRFGNNYTNKSSRNLQSWGLYSSVYIILTGQNKNHKVECKFFRWTVGCSKYDQQSNLLIFLPQNCCCLFVSILLSFLYHTCWHETEVIIVFSSQSWCIRVKRLRTIKYRPRLQLDFVNLTWF